MLVLQDGEIRHVLVLYYYSLGTLGYSREGKSTSGVGNPYAPHPLNKSLNLEPPLVDLEIEYGHLFDQQAT